MKTSGRSEFIIYDGQRVSYIMGWDLAVSLCITSMDEWGFFLAFDEMSQWDLLFLMKSDDLIASALGNNHFELYYQSLVVLN